MSKSLSFHSPGHLRRLKMFGVSCEAEQLSQRILEMATVKIGKKVNWLELQVVI